MNIFTRWTRWLSMFGWKSGISLGSGVETTRAQDSPIGQGWKRRVGSLCKAESDIYRFLGREGNKTKGTGHRRGGEGHRNAKGH